MTVSRTSSMNKVLQGQPDGSMIINIQKNANEEEDLVNTQTLTSKQGTSNKVTSKQKNRRKQSKSPHCKDTTSKRSRKRIVSSSRSRSRSKSQRKRKKKSKGDMSKRNMSSDRRLLSTVSPQSRDVSYVTKIKNGKLTKVSPQIHPALLSPTSVEKRVWTRRSRESNLTNRNLHSKHRSLAKASRGNLTFRSLQNMGRIGLLRNDPSRKTISSQSPVNRCKSSNLK